MGLFNEKGRSRPSFGVAGTSSQDGILTSEEIRDKKLELRELTEITIPDLTEKLKLARLSGLRGDIEAASISLEKATNKANDLSKAVGSASASAATFNTMFASSLQAGGVGPDWGGFSDLADMTREELEEIAKGGLGKSKAIAERAQAYLDRMNTGGTTGAGTPDKETQKTTKSGLANIDKTMEKGYETLDKSDATYWDGLTKRSLKTFDEIIKKESDYFVTHQENLISLEALELAHWVYLTGLQVTALSAMSASDAQFTRFVAENPTIKNIGIVVWTEEGANWDPTKNAEFMQTARVAAVLTNVPTFITPKFKQVDGLDAGTKTENKTVNNDVKIEQNFYGKTDPKQVEKATAEGMNKALGNLAALSGGLP